MDQSEAATSRMPSEENDFLNMNQIPFSRPYFPYKRQGMPNMQSDLWEPQLLSTSGPQELLYHNYIPSSYNRNSDLDKPHIKVNIIADKRNNIPAFNKSDNADKRQFFGMVSLVNPISSLKQTLQEEKGTKKLHKHKRDASNFVRVPIMAEKNFGIIQDSIDEAIETASKRDQIRKINRRGIENDPFGLEPNVVRATVHGKKAEKNPILQLLRAAAGTKTQKILGLNSKSFDIFPGPLPNENGESPNSELGKVSTEAPSSQLPTSVDQQIIQNFHQGRSPQRPFLHSGPGIARSNPLTRQYMKGQPSLVSAPQVVDMAPSTFTITDRGFTKPRQMMGNRNPFPLLYQPQSIPYGSNHPGTGRQWTQQNNPSLGMVNHDKLIENSFAISPPPPVEFAPPPQATQRYQEVVNQAPATPFQAPTMLGPMDQQQPTVNRDTFPFFPERIDHAVPPQLQPGDLSLLQEAKYDQDSAMMRQFEEARNLREQAEREEIQQEEAAQDITRDEENQERQIAEMHQSQDENAVTEDSQVNAVSRQQLPTLPYVTKSMFQVPETTNQIGNLNEPQYDFAPRNKFMNFDNHLSEIQSSEGVDSLASVPIRLSLPRTHLHPQKVKYVSGKPHQAIPTSALGNFAPSGGDEGNIDEDDEKPEVHVHIQTEKSDIAKPEIISNKKFVRIRTAKSAIAKPNCVNLANPTRMVNNSTANVRAVEEKGDAENGKVKVS